MAPSDLDPLGRWDRRIICLKQAAQVYDLDENAWKALRERAVLAIPTPAMLPDTLLFEQISWLARLLEDDKVRLPDGSF